MVISFDHVLNMYNALYCNRTHRAVTDRAGELCITTFARDKFANFLIDAALECCGHPFYAGSVSFVFLKVAELGDPDLEGRVMEHLLNFATEDHIESLKNSIDSRGGNHA